MIINSQITRFCIFIFIFLCFSLIERFRAAHKQKHAIIQRCHNLSIAICCQILLSLLFIINGISIANLTENYQLGLFNLLLMPNSISIIFGIIILDLAIYGQHIAMHRYPLLWRLHQVHHTDVILNATSGIRFHPLEALLSMCYRSCIILLLGLPVISVICFETILNSMSLFSHANIKLPKKLDIRLRKILITPKLHVIHHTINYQDQNHNFGFSTSLWDRLFKTYQDTSNESQLGIKNQRSKTTSLLNSLLLPFKK